MVARGESQKVDTHVVSVHQMTSTGSVFPSSYHIDAGSYNLSFDNERCSESMLPLPGQGHRSLPCNLLSFSFHAVCWWNAWDLSKDPDTVGAAGAK